MVMNFFHAPAHVQEGTDIYDDSYTQFYQHYVYVRKKYV